MNIIVQKYGGTSVANKEKLEEVCKKIINTYNKKNGVVVVVSAQGDTTDLLLDKAKGYTNNNYEREMDLLLSTGEIQTIALLTMMLKDKGYNLKIEVDTSKRSISDAIKLLNPDNIIDINISNTPLEDIISDIYKKEDKK